MTLGHSEFFRDAKGVSDLLPKKATHRSAQNKRGGARARKHFVLDSQEANHCRAAARAARQ